MNIIGGFAQVLNENYHELPPEETSNIIHMMQDNTRKFVRISRMLVAASASDDEKAIKKHEFCCNSLCRDIVNSIRLTSPHLVKLSFETTLPDTFTINSDEDKVRAILTELLDNANKFTQRGTITLTCRQRHGYRHSRRRPASDLHAILEDRRLYRGRGTGTATEQAHGKVARRRPDSRPTLSRRLELRLHTQNLNFGGKEKRVRHILLMKIL